jgi:hypothetical protein
MRFQWKGVGAGPINVTADPTLLINPRSATRTPSSEDSGTTTLLNNSSMNIPGTLDCESFDSTDSVSRVPVSVSQCALLFICGVTIILTVMVCWVCGVILCSTEETTDPSVSVPGPGASQDGQRKGGGMYGMHK